MLGEAEHAGSNYRLMWRTQAVEEISSNELGEWGRPSRETEDD